jgi:ELWxxDGT repeat protein
MARAENWLLTLLLGAAAIGACALLPDSAPAAPGDVHVSLVSDIRPGGSSEVHNLTDVNGTLFFGANDGTNGDELWKTDGTTTSMIDVFPGPDGSFPGDLTNVNGTLFFDARDAINQQELWKLEPPYTTPVKIKINPALDQGSGPANLVNFNGTLFLTAYDGSSFGGEVWKSDGGPVGAGTVRVTDINPSGDSFPEQLTPVGNALFFAATDGNDGENKELWRTNGNVGNQTELEINPVADEGSDPLHLTNFNGTLFLEAQNDTVGLELWKAGVSDSSATPIDIVGGSGDSDPSNLTTLGGMLFFNASDGAGDAELWKSNGGPLGAGGTERVADINPTGSSYPESMIAYMGKLYFAATDGVHGEELWRSDGGPLGPGHTELISDINPGPAEGVPSATVISSGNLWFRATDAAGTELWKTDGTSLRMADIAPGAAGSQPQYLTDSGGTLFFSADDGTSTDRELWKATAEPTTPPTTGGGGGGTTAQQAPARKRCKKAKHRAAAAKKKCKKKK